MRQILIGKYKCALVIQEVQLNRKIQGLVKGKEKQCRKTLGDTKRFIDKFENATALKYKCCIKNQKQWNAISG